MTALETEVYELINHVFTATDVYFNFNLYTGSYCRVFAVHIQDLGRLVQWNKTLDIGVGTGGAGGGGLGPLTFLFEGAQYDRDPLTFEKCRPIFELKVTPYFQS